jgi:hypothetical protein
MTAAFAPRHMRPPRPGFLARLRPRREPAAFAAPAHEPVTRGFEVPPVTEPLPPLPAPVPPAALITAPSFRPAPAALGRVANGLRAMDGTGTPSRDYRTARSYLETQPFRAVPEAVPAPGPAYPPPRDLAADLADLPAFREAVRRRTRCHASRCMCGQEVAGDTWGGRMVAAGTHLLGGAA